MKSKFDTSENNFDFLRFGFASLVILSHTWPINRGPAAADPLGMLIKGRSLGELAVDGFFVISGFLIAGSWARSHGLLPFLKKRVLRIYPGFIVLMMLQAFVLAPYLAEGVVQPYTLRQLALIAGETVDLVGYGYPYGGLYTLLSHSPIPELNGAIWTIRYEFVCYLLLAVLGVAGLLRRPRVMVVLFIVVLFAHATHMAMPSTKIVTAVLGASGSWPRFATYFLAGATFHLLRDRIPYSARLAGFSGAGLLACILMPSMFDLLMPTLGTYLLFWFAMRRGPLNRFGRLGDFSYGMYLYGFPMQQLIFRAFGAWMPLAAQFFCAWVGAIICGIASWNLVERWFLRRRTVVGVEAHAAS